MTSREDGLIKTTHVMSCDADAYAGRSTGTASLTFAYPVHIEKLLIYCRPKTFFFVGKGGGFINPDDEYFCEVDQYFPDEVCNSFHWPVAAGELIHIRFRNRTDNPALEPIKIEMVVLHRPEDVA